MANFIRLRPAPFAATSTSMVSRNELHARHAGCLGSARELRIFEWKRAACCPGAGSAGDAFVTASATGRRASRRTSMPIFRTLTMPCLADRRPSATSAIGEDLPIASSRRRLLALVGAREVRINRADGRY